MFEIRAYHPSDLPKVYEICLRTGREGEDATGHVDGELLGHYFAAPYVTAEPELCFVLTQSGTPVGYILGTADSNAFGAWCERHWLPVLRARYPLPDVDDTSRDAQVIRYLHARYRPEPGTERYPAHLHIDIVPAGQGHGLGTRLIDRFERALEERGVAGYHFGVNARNSRALGFYRHLGFDEIRKNERGSIFARALPP